MPPNDESYQLVIGEDARLDIQEIVEWYEQQKPELGIDFFLEFENAVKILESMPQRYPVTFSFFRKLPLKKFPYNIFYAIDEGDFIVEIVAIFHIKRDKKTIEKKVSNK